MIYLHHFIGRTWILSLYRKPLVTIKEALAPKKPNALHSEDKKCDRIYENRVEKFNLLCPSYMKWGKITMRKGQNYKMMGWMQDGSG